MKANEGVKSFFEARTRGRFGILTLVVKPRLMAIQRGDSIIGAEPKPGADEAWVGQGLDAFVIEKEGSSIVASAEVGWCVGVAGSVVR